MKIQPNEIRCVEVKGAKGARLHLYRDTTLAEERDSLRGSTGILRARGLWCDVGSEWTPGEFCFRKAKATPVPLVVEHEWMLQWFVAGILLGERFDPYGGRVADFDHAEDVWRHWIHWQLGDRKTLFTQDCAEHLKTTADAVRVLLARVGLSAKPQ